ncbi:ATP-binding protein [Legionella cardiaca]|uniref:histidine kinase n=1 Tax=Legionella cardiaca TaxID=1071983 RepID=A0ABY8AUL7_9GAMM|nr:ATP-binding protein [Legionella cardiaca]WED43086.1 ATP-binding protein [Legionella cardiaca]
MQHPALSEVQKNLEEVANQLCLAVKGDFNFTIAIDTANESMQKLTMLVNFVLDTARRSLLEVQEKNTKLMELDQLKSDFIANISHELRTPLTLILAPLKTILSNSLLNFPPDVLQNLERIQRNAARLYTLVNNILDFSKLEAGKFELHEEPVNLNEFLFQLTDDVKDLATERQINLQFQSHAVIKDVLLDKQMLEKSILNLLSNALKFTPAGGTVIVELDAKAEKIFLRIIDNGAGIPEAKIPFIFERFHQLDSSRTRAYEGTGIGLTVVKQFLDLMQGTISIQSQLGQGTTFTICLPARFATTSHKSIPIEKISNVVETFKVSLTLNKSTDSNNKSAEIEKELPRLVLADDNLDVQAYISTLLQDKFEVITANNGQEALATIHKSKPHVILSDIMMPLIDGYQLTNILKTQPETCHIPIILITAQAGENAVSTSLEVGADDYLSKPFSPEELIARINSAYKHYQQYLQNCSLNSQLLNISRRAGMADVATSILHNIGNVLNSVKISLDMMKESAKQPYLQNLTTISAMLADNKDNLAQFLTEDVKGKILPDYLIALTKKINESHETIKNEMLCLQNQISHIEDVVAMQEELSGISGVAEKVSINDLINIAISMCKNSLEKRQVTIQQDIKEQLFITTDKAKLLQILINLIQNAIDALSAFNTSKINKFICFKAEKNPEADSVSITVQDNGIGIKKEHLDKIFTFGFTTKSYGHGFGLHTSALAAKELGGNLQMKSEGLGYGAEFTLTLPLKQVNRRYLNDNSYEKRENPHY